MDHIWAPWRLEWATQDKARLTSPDKCPFCEILKESPSIDNLVFYKDTDLAVVLNKFPFNSGHILVIPTKHLADPRELDEVVLTKITKAQIKIIDILEKELNSQGFNLGLNLGKAGGAGLPEHLHWHIVPRWIGDSNFMPVVSECKVIPAHRKTIYQKLKMQFADFSDAL